jgi:hypothetical protein
MNAATESAAARLLARLDGVRRVGEGRWRARCPAHGSRAQSVVIADRDGRVLLHAFCGCPTDAVLSAIGLQIADLFDRPVGDFAPSRTPWAPRDVIDLVLAESAVVAVIACDVLKQRSVSETDWQRLAKASSRLARLDQVVRT